VAIFGFRAICTLGKVKRVCCIGEEFFGRAGSISKISFEHILKRSFKIGAFAGNSMKTFVTRRLSLRCVDHFVGRKEKFLCETSLCVVVKKLLKERRPWVK